MVVESNFTELQESFKVTTLSIEDERKVLLSEVYSLQRSLEESDGVFRCLEHSRESSRLDLQNVTKELDGKHNELEVLQAQFAAEVQRLAAAAVALEKANGQIQRMKDEIATMEAARKADEEVMQQVSTGYRKLRELHAECLAEVDGLVGIVRERKRG